MELQSVKSSMVSKIGYEDGTVEIHFSKGGIYTYDNVTEEDYNELKSAHSIGQFLHKTFYKKYKGKKKE